MGKKALKATRKFAASGQLKKTIDARRKHRDIRKKAERRKNGKGKDRQVPEDAIDGDSEEEEEPGKFKGMSVDDFLGGGFMEEGDDGDVADGENEDGEESDEEGGGSDDQSFASVDDLDDEGQSHLVELSKLAEKDPEFYKYLQENDRELLEFDPDTAEADPDDASDHDAMEEDKVPTLTKKILQRWQKALLEERSLRALRKLLIAFRSAAHMHEEDQVFAWSIDSPSVYQKLVTTALKYTPVVLEHHCPSKSQVNGKFKPPTQTPKWKTLQKLVLSHFHNVMHLLTQLTDAEMMCLALTESAKLVPFIIGSRKAVKVYLKTCLELWSTAEDSVRIAAFLAVRKLAFATDEAIMDMVLKNTYLTLVRSCKSTSAHTLPSINLMKNSASEIYCMDHAAAYQHAFGYIRQLAIHLRNSMKVKSKDAYKQVYNWQYVHCIDFWAIVLARACDQQALADRHGEESELKALIYPLVQVSLGAIRLIHNARSYPFHLHIIRALLHLTQHTHTYVPLAPFLLPMLTAPLLARTKPKASTLRPLDLDTHIRAPQQHLRTRAYAAVTLEDAAFLLAEHLASKPVQSSIAFPETVGPVVLLLRRALRAGKAAPWFAREVAQVRALVDHIEGSVMWVQGHRKGVAFGPGQLNVVAAWELSVNVAMSPLARWVAVQRKVREKRRALVEKAREGEDEILED
ncbi:Noc2-domain-containing protein [Amylocystis lapponica]|nr:Noc2-domain-containing protein [Amylocystis lapponica]